MLCPCLQLTQRLKCTEQDLSPNHKEKKNFQADKAALKLPGAAAFEAAVWSYFSGRIVTEGRRKEEQGNSLARGWPRDLFPCRTDTKSTHPLSLL